MHFLAQLTPLRTCTRDHDERDRDRQDPRREHAERGRQGGGAGEPERGQIAEATDGGSLHVRKMMLGGRKPASNRRQCRLLRNI